MAAAHVENKDDCWMNNNTNALIGDTTAPWVQHVLHQLTVSAFWEEASCKRTENSSGSMSTYDMQMQECHVTGSTRRSSYDHQPYLGNKNNVGL
jgi:hypothetical protein